MEILVTGGTGRIGANLVKDLLARGHEVRSFVYPGDRSRAHKLDGFDRVQTVEGDLRNLDEVKRAVDGVDAIYHLAAAFTGPFDHTEFLAINAMGTLNILECIRTGLPNLHRFVYASTEAIYWELTERGYCFDEPVREEMVARYHQMPYFLTKWIGEELAMTYHHQFGVPTTVFRFSTVIEPSEFLNDEGLPNLFLLRPTYERYRAFETTDPEEKDMVRTLRSLWNGEEKFLLSRTPDGRPFKRQFCDVRDIVQGLVLGIDKEAAVGEEFTLSGAALFRWDEIVPYLSDRYKLEYVEARIPLGLYHEFDLSKIVNLLGYKPAHDFDSVLETAEAIRRGEETDVIPTGIAFR